MSSMVVARGVSARPAMSGTVLALVVLLLTVGVIAMHSLGTAHQMPMPVPTSPRTSMPMAVLAAVPAPVTAASVMTPAVVHHAPGSAQHLADLPGKPLPSAPAQVIDGSTAHAGSAGSAGSMAGDVAMSSHGLMAICLAVVPLLVLLLRRAASAWFRLVDHRPVRPRSAVQQIHARWPGAADVSLSRLCVLRT